MPLTEQTRPCWEARCDSCGDGDNAEWGGGYHYASRDEAVKELRSVGWEVAEDGTVTCEECAYKREAPDA